MAKEDISYEAARFSFSRSRLLLLGDKFRAARFQGVFREEILGKTRVIAATVEKKLSRTAAVVLPRKLHGGPRTVF